MKKYNILAISLFVLLASITWIQAESNQDVDTQLQIVELKNQINLLKERIEILEKKLQSFARSSYVYIPENFPKVQKVPEDWGVFEYNGMTYYSIPLKMEQKKEKQEKK